VVHLKGGVVAVAQIEDGGLFRSASGRAHQKSEQFHSVQGGRVNKSDVIVKLAERADISQPIAEKVLQAIYEAMKDTMREGGRIEIRGFGSFTVRERDGYTGRNPKTSEKISVRPKRVPFFKPGKELKERVDSYHPSKSDEGQGGTKSQE
jgi:integration host factor subunit beta